MFRKMEERGGSFHEAHLCVVVGLAARVTFLDPPPLAPAELSASMLRAQDKVHVVHLSIANLPNMKASYAVVAQAAARDCAWVLFLDSDEFMYASLPGDTVASVLRGFVATRPAAGQVATQRTRGVPNA